MQKINGAPYYKHANFLNQQYRLIKPLIYSRCYYNEWPLSYIHRLSAMNGYSKINWLVQNKLDHPLKNKISNLLAYRLAYKNDWSIPSFILKGVRTLSANFKYINTHTLRICPLCLKLALYIRYEWVFLFSSSCLIHNILLQDICPYCSKQIDYIHIYQNKCECGKKITEFPIQFVGEQCDLIQRVMENKKINHQTIDKLNHINKLKILHFLFLIISPKNTQFNERQIITMKDNIVLIKLLAQTLLNSKEGFWYFLKNFIHSMDKYSNRLMPFYRQFNQQFKSYLFCEYKRYLDEFINLYWRNHITNRNTLFSKSILANHAWLPISKVKAQFNLTESLIIKAAIKGFIRSETIYNELHFMERHKPRYYHLYYKPDIIKHLSMLQGTISFKKVCLLLGTTKIQLNSLIKNNHFNFIIAPEDAYQYLENKYNSLAHIIEKYGTSIENRITKGNTWLFLASEIEDYLQNILKQALHSVDLKDLLALPDAMRAIGNKIKEAYNEIITAMINQELPIFIPDIDKPTLRDIHIPTKALIDWINQKTRQHTYMTIPQMAKQLSISQQFAYELINHKLMPYTIIEGSNTRWITEDNIKTFNKNYIILSKLAKEKGISSKELMKKLDTMNDDYKKLECQLKQIVYINLLFSQNKPQ